MLHRAFSLTILLAITIFFYGCGGDNPSGPEPGSEPEPEQGVISGTVTASDGSGGIEDALIKLVENESVSQETFSNVGGEFSFAKVEVGQYEVKMTLPRGYRESGPTSKTVQVDDDASVEFEGEPIKEETATVKAGNQDTVATASGAFVAIDASSASSDMEVTISEIESDTDAESESKPVKVHIRPPGSSKSSVSSAKRMLNSASTTAASVNVSLGQKVNKTGPASLAFGVESEDGMILFYANPEQKNLVDPKTKKESAYYTHAISTTPTTDSEFRLLGFKKLDNSCDNSNRILESVPSDEGGQISLILIHGIQSTLGLCDDFDTYDPLNLDDNDEENTFDKLVKKILPNSEINDKYRLYTYKYPTNAPIQEASAELWNQIERNDQIQKPVIIAHSMGGLVARKMVAMEGSDAIRGLITLGTPHNGTPIANDAEFISNAIEAYCLSPTNLFNPICLVDFFKGGILPNTPGLRDLRPQNVEENFDTLDVKKDKTFTLGGDLGSLDNISSNNTIIYKLGYTLMKIDGKANDGMVPTSSASPDWSSNKTVLEGHDHSEIRDGDDLNSNAVFEHIQKILSQLAQNGTVTAPTINTIISNPNPSYPGETVSFSADVTGDEPIGCEWSFGDGATSAECNTSHSYQTTGTYEVSLKATNDGGSDTAIRNHEVVQSDMANVIYVDADATDNNDGSSWDSAYKNLQDALAQAETGNEIWVAEGTYFPDQGEQQTEGDRQATFQLKNGVGIYGGFTGTETARSQRDWENNITTLSGDIGIEGDMSDNSLHVVTGSGTDNSAIIDGFDIEAGNASDYSHETGGGMYNENGSPVINNTLFKDNNAHDYGGGMYNRNSNPHIANIIFQNNTVDGFGVANAGGGMYNYSSSPVINKCNFKNNFSASEGGGMSNVENSNPSISDCSFLYNAADKGAGLHNKDNSNPTVRKSNFFENTSTYGGGIYNANNSNPIISNVKLIGNTAEESGGGMYNDNSSPKVVGSLFSGNTAKFGGGLRNSGNDVEAMIINSTFSKNSASDDGGGMFVSYSSFKITNTIFWGNTAASDGNQLDQNYSEISISNSIIEGGIPDYDNFIDNGNNSTSNPLFIDAVGSDNIPGTMDDNLHLQTGSPAIDAGLNSALDLDGDGDTTDDVPVDLDGNTRIQNGTVDIGAYETGGN